MLIEQPPKIFRALYPEAIFRMSPKEKAIYLTFDDGPIPEVTPWVLDLLNEHQIKATFFMVGDNVRKYPQVFQRVVEEGHQIGNHTFNHLRGFEQNTTDYIENITKAKEFIDSPLFRPPHGQLKPQQYKVLKEQYKIIMWDLVTRDYSKIKNGSEVYEYVLKYTRSGSIVTFHDSLKSWNKGNLQFALPRSIEFWEKEGYEFKLL